MAGDNRGWTSVLSIVLMSCLGALLAQAERCTFGEGCKFPCRCAYGGCNRDAGVCLDPTSKCETGQPRRNPWHGPSCQLGNVAYGKQAWQKGLIRRDWGADKAVDGSINSYTCAHPSRTGQGWLMIDLGQLHRIFLIIFSNTVLSSWTFAKDMQFFVSNRSIETDALMTDFTGFSMCGQQTIGREDNAEIVCRTPMVGRYVLVYKNSTESPAGSFLACEVAVIGNIYLPCTGCAGECNHIFGCIKDCPVGKNQSTFCQEDCYGSYGFHCKNSCSGHCHGNPLSCSPIDGRCPGGCEKWWTGDKCDVYIEQIERSSISGKVRMKSSTIESLTIAWPAMSGIDPNLADHYGYYVTFRPTNTRSLEREQLDIPYEDRSRVTVTLRNLTFNTRYEVKVTPYRMDKGDTEKTGFSKSVNARTKCIVPETPRVSNLTSFYGESTNIQSVKVMWEIPPNIGCDSIKKVYVHYSNGRKWRKESASPSRQNHVFTPMRPGFYAVKVTIVNNQDLNATSHILAVNVQGTGPFPDYEYEEEEEEEEEEVDEEDKEETTTEADYVETDSNISEDDSTDAATQIMQMMSSLIMSIVVVCLVIL